MTQTIPTTSAESEDARIIERPDGFYWEALEGGRVHGPFSTLMEAELDMQGFDEELEGDEAEALRDAEDVLGVPDWVDPETGLLADDEWTRTEDH